MILETVMRQAPQRQVAVGIGSYQMGFVTYVELEDQTQDLYAF